MNWDKILFTPGPFESRSGKILEDGKIDCDALSTVEMEWCADYIARRVKFSGVMSVSTGGDRLEEFLRPHRLISGPTLIVDDVLTTGESMEKTKRDFLNEGSFGLLPGGTEIIGYVIFARGPLPPWIKAIFYMEDAVSEVKRK
jgi:hypothetical protein